MTADGVQNGPNPTADRSGDMADRDSAAQYSTEPPLLEVRQLTTELGEPPKPGQRRMGRGRALVDAGDSPAPAAPRPVRVCDALSFDIRPGETLALVGESGCGKSMTALSLMRLLPLSGRILSGSVRLEGRDLLDLTEREMRAVRGGQLGMIFQEPQTSLNPVLTIGEQIGEAVRLHGRFNPATELSGAARTDGARTTDRHGGGRRGSRKAEAIRARVLALLDAVGIPDAERRVDEYPHQLSGGMKQRVMIAMALAGDPRLLVADEPTTALDVTIQAQVLQLLKGLQRETGMAVLLITHDLGVVAETADRLAVMYAGQIVEQASVDAFFRAPAHPYSRKLLESLPGADKRGSELAMIPGRVPPLDQAFVGCRFAPRCDSALPECVQQPPKWFDAEPSAVSGPDSRAGSGSEPRSTAHQVRCLLWAEGRPDFGRSGPLDQTEGVAKPVPIMSAAINDGAGDRRPETFGGKQLAPIIEVRGLQVHFPIQRGLFKRTVGHVRAVDGIDLALRPGETLALVGESGCGKTTAGKGLLQLERPTGGSVHYQGENLARLGVGRMRRFRKDLQIIFQDPFASMNPRMLVGDIVGEGLQALGMARRRVEREQRVAELLEQVGIGAEAMGRYPHEFSGGQRQRICIARALAVEPQVIVCDEPTSALDVSVQAQILNLLKQLQRDLGLSYLFITHDISVVAYMAQEIAVMYLGRIVERGPADAILRDPRHPYTQALLSAVPSVEAAERREIIRLQGDLPSPANPPNGCHFHPRCPKVSDRCRQAYPELTQLEGARSLHCHYPE